MNRITELTPVDVKQIFELAYIAFDEGELMNSTLPLLRQLRDAYSEIWKDYTRIDLGDEPPITELTPVDVKQIFELAYIAFEGGELMDSTLPLLRQLRDAYSEIWKPYKHIDLGDEPKTTIYLVTSEGTVYAGYSTRKLAEAALEGFAYPDKSVEIEEVVLDSRILPKGRCWEIWMEADGSIETISRIAYSNNDSPIVQCAGGGFLSYAFGETRADAIKVAQELRVGWLGENSG